MKFKSIPIIRSLKSPIFLLFTALIFTSQACDLINSNLDSNEEDKNITKTYYPNGKLKAIIPVDDNRERHGVLKQYYESGNIKSEISYDHGTKLNAVQFYQNGKKQMEFTYKDGYKHGVRTKYWSNGNIHSTLEYVDGNPTRNLTEFTKKGKKVTNYPKLIVNQIDNLNYSGQYLIEVYFSSNRGRGDYYEGGLVDDSFNKHIITQLKEQNGKGILSIKPAPGTFIMRKVTFLGKYKTPMGNPYFVEKTVNVAIDF